MRPYQDEYRNEVVELAKLALNDPVIREVTFVNCTIVGPAVIVPQGNTTIRNCSWDAPSFDAVAWVISDSRDQVVGAIALDSCTLTSCRMQGIGLAVPASRYDEMARGFAG